VSKAASLEYTWESIGLPKWSEVVDAHAEREPSRPIPQRGKIESQRRIEVADALGLTGSSYRFFADYAGRRVFAPHTLLVKKLARYANHAAYAAWFERTLSAPLEAWIHADGGPFSSDKTEQRIHYFAAYLGPHGGTTHMVVAAALDPRGPKLINGFSVTSHATADHKRFGLLDYIGYDPSTTPRKAKGEIPTYRIAPLP
jgi:hypothetical protein